MDMEPDVQVVLSKGEPVFVDGYHATVDVYDASDPCYAHIPIKVCKIIKFNPGCVKGWAQSSFANAVQTVTHFLQTAWRCKRTALTKPYLKTQLDAYILQSQQLIVECNGCSRTVMSRMAVMLHEEIIPRLIAYAESMKQKKRQE